MKKIILILNHVTAGMGSDENAQLPPSGKKAALGPGRTLNPLFQEQDAQIVATLYCGDQYYHEHQEEVNKKFVGIAKKFEADAVLCKEFQGLQRCQRKTQQWQSMPKTSIF